MTELARDAQPRRQPGVAATLASMLTDTRVHIAILAVLAMYFLVWPVWRLGFPIEIAQNEGWNAYHADAAMGAAPLYPASDTLIVNNYPPLSFYVVGGLAKVFGDALYVGRMLSIIAVPARLLESRRGLRAVA
jgi:hypothetical protein